MESNEQVLTGGTKTFVGTKRAVYRFCRQLRLGKCSDDHDSNDDLGDALGVPSFRSSSQIFCVTWRPKVLPQTLECWPKLTVFGPDPDTMKLLSYNSASPHCGYQLFIALVLVSNPGGTLWIPFFHVEGTCAGT